MRKKQIQTLTLMAILTALSIVLKKFSIDTGLFRISLFDTPIIIAGMIAGPLWGVLVGFYSDLIYGLISGYQFSFIMMLSALVWGLCGGVLYKKKPKYLVLLLVVLISSVITTTINSLQLYIFYRPKYQQYFLYYKIAKFYRELRSKYELSLNEQGLFLSFLLYRHL